MALYHGRHKCEERERLHCGRDDELGYLFTSVRDPEAANLERQTTLAHEPLYIVHFILSHDSHLSVSTRAHQRCHDHDRAPKTVMPRFQSAPFSSGELSEVTNCRRLAAI